MPARNNDIREQIAKEYLKTPNYPAIAQKLGMTKTQVAHYARSMGLPSQRSTNIIWVDDETVECSRCQKHVPYSSLPKIRVGKPNQSTSSYCRQCRTKQIIKNDRSSLEAYAKRSIRKLRVRSKEQDLFIDLTSEQFCEIYKKQEGKCFYTNVKLSFQSDSKSNEKISVDKIIPAKGYTLDNVVLCSVRANTIKSNCSLEELQEWLPSWYSKLLVKLTKNE